MKKYLIHAQNTILTENKYFSKEEQLAFKVDSDVSDIDFYMSQLIDATLGEILLNTDVLFIKVGLSANYLEYAGIRLAYHIRLTEKLGSKAHLPIVFIAEESFQFLSSTAEIPQILFTKGIYLMKDNGDELETYLSNSKIRPLANFADFLNKIKIVPASNYRSHHSIANEWSLLRWSEILSVDLNSNLSVKKDNIESSLYYKYLLARNPINEIDNPGYVKIDELGKILYIDDEWDKGWTMVLGKLLSKITNSKTFETFEMQYKGLKSEDIVQACSKRIKDTDPDIIILDLRLCDDDFRASSRIDDLTGCKVLKFIKEYNPGIQVIIFSATNKVWNLMELQSAEADSFILKTSPEYYQDDMSNVKSITAMCEAIKRASERKFIKSLVNICRNISSNLDQVDPFENDKYRRFIAGLKSKIKICLSSIKMIDLEKPATIDIAFISFYNFLESFNKHYIYEEHYNFYMGEDGTDFVKYFYDNGTLKNEGAFERQGKYDKPSWSVGLKALFIDYFKISSRPYQEIKSLENMQEDRNNYIHSTKSSFTQNELVEIVTICKKICSKLKD